MGFPQGDTEGLPPFMRPSPPPYELPPAKQLILSLLEGRVGEDPTSPLGYFKIYSLSPVQVTFPFLFWVPIRALLRVVSSSIRLSGHSILSTDDGDHICWHVIFERKIESL